MIDHPHVFRELSDERHPYSTDGPMCRLVTSSISEALNKYSQEVANIMNPTLEREFTTWSFKPETFVPGRVNEKGSDEKKAVGKPPIS